MVKKVITKPDSSKVSGPDCIPVVVLKSCEPELSYMLNSSLKIYYHVTHVYHKRQSYDIWLLRYETCQTEFFVILGHFLPVYTPNSPKNQN